MKKLVIAYIPVIHKGYIEFLERHASKSSLLLLIGDSLAECFMPRREIRALDAETVGYIVGNLPNVNFSLIKVLTPEDLPIQLSGKEHIFAANDEVVRRFVKKHLNGAKIQFDTAFLRWDETQVFSNHNVQCDRVSQNITDIRFMKRAREVAGQSSDWWRQVGALVVKFDDVLFEASNSHFPTEHSPYIDGDPRDVIPAGKSTHLTTALHSEQAVIGEAARKGESLLGTSLYVTVFPCPMCAISIAKAGIKRVLFQKGHASLDGVETLRQAGVTIIRVNAEENPSK